jgi:Family of unknown function (DUF5947)
MTTTPEPRDLFASLRQFVRRHPRREGESSCELCGISIVSDHAHLLETKNRKVVCSCDACAILFSSGAANSYRRVPRMVRLLDDFVLTDPQWEDLGIPINIAFFSLRADSLKPAVYYPSPAGATESLLEMESWQTIAKNNPALRSIEPEVEALLVNRMTTPHEYYIAPIDEAYKLVGLIRSKWRGFSGGTDVWQAIGTFFTSLKARSAPARKVSHARPDFSD